MGRGVCWTKKAVASENASLCRMKYCCWTFCHFLKYVFVLLEILFNISESNEERIIKGIKSALQPSNKPTMPRYNNETIIDEQTDSILKFFVF